MDFAGLPINIPPLTWFASMEEAMSKSIKSTVFLSLCISLILLVNVCVAAQTDRERSAKKAREAADQSAKAARVFDQIMATREKAIPQDLLDRAEAVAVFPLVGIGLIPDPLGVAPGIGVLCRRRVRKGEKEEGAEEEGAFHGPPLGRKAGTGMKGF